MIESTILTLIGSLGFPIVACIWLALSFKKTVDANTASNLAIQHLLTKICEKLNITDTK